MKIVFRIINGDLYFEFPKKEYRKYYFWKVWLGKHLKFGLFELLKINELYNFAGLKVFVWDSCIGDYFPNLFDNYFYLTFCVGVLFFSVGFCESFSSSSFFTSSWSNGQ